MTTDGADRTRHIPPLVDAEAAATMRSRHTYPADRAPFDVDAFTDELVADAARFRWRATVAVLGLLVVGCLVGVVLGIAL